jgi:hypothetical protein
VPGPCGADGRSTARPWPYQVRAGPGAFLPSVSPLVASSSVVRDDKGHRQSPRMVSLRAAPLFDDGGGAARLRSGRGSLGRCGLTQARPATSSARAQGAAGAGPEVHGSLPLAPRAASFRAGAAAPRLADLAGPPARPRRSAVASRRASRSMARISASAHDACSPPPFGIRHLPWAPFE